MRAPFFIHSSPNLLPLPRPCQSGFRGLCRPSSTATSSTTISSRARPPVLLGVSPKRGDHLLSWRLPDPAWRVHLDAPVFLFQLAPTQVEEQREAQAAELDRHAAGRGMGAWWGGRWSCSAPPPPLSCLGGGRRDASCTWLCVVVFLVVGVVAGGPLRQRLVPPARRARAAPRHTG